nr:hypothetical protein [uncultured Mediterranean phage uvMED]
MKIYCCGCADKVDARLTSGEEIYPRRPDLASLPFWKCDECGNFVGCHHKTKNRTRPLGHIATPKLRNARRYIHEILDPLWKKHGMDRRELYKYLSQQLGWEYHSANLRDIAEARKVYKLINEIRKQEL